MPKIDVSYSDLCSLIGKKIDIQTLRDSDILYAKCEVDEQSGDNLKLDVKDTNRPDLWSAEGVAREIRLRYKSVFPTYKIGKSNVSVIVDKSVKSVRPYTACAVVRNLKIDRNVLAQLIQLQEKISGTFGSNRRNVAIGVYDLKKIKLPIRYTTVRPDGVKFVPLDFEKELTPREIIEKHPKGKEFGHLLKGAERFPIFMDSANNVLSVPPIINSNHLGKVTENTKDIFIECSGSDMRFLTTAINVISAALYERGGKVESVKVIYEGKTVITPSMEPKKYSIDMDYLRKISGLNLSVKEVIVLLKKSGYDVRQKNNSLELLYPAYRQDLMHPRDVVEDVIISYGMNAIEPEYVKLSTAGGTTKKELFSKKVVDVMIGLGMQEILSYTLSNKDDMFQKMNMPAETIAEVDNPVSLNWSVFRNWLLPGIMEFLSKNKHVEYPQKIFEIGDCVLMEDKNETKVRDARKIAVAISNSLVSYEEISSLLDALLTNLGLKYSLRPHNHKSFIEGRCAEVYIAGRKLGFIGEIHPQVLNSWKLEKPVVAFELDVEEMMR